jgi:four helix bundle protein
MARGSLFELESQTTVAHDLGFWTADEANATTVLVSDVAKPLSGLIRSLEP